jgi:hypothetical protein
VAFGSISDATVVSIKNNIINTWNDTPSINVIDVPASKMISISRTIAKWWFSWIVVPV